MKNLFFLLVVLFVAQVSNAQCDRVAPFEDGPDYTIDGSATLTFLINGTKTLSFDSNFSTTPGPDLHVYLSQSSVVSTPEGILETPNTIDLGLLKNSSGAQSYDLTNLNPSLDLTTYDYVIIHCKEYDHYWGTGTFGTQIGSDCAAILSDTDITNVPFLVYPTVITNNQLSIQLATKEKVTLSFYSVLGQLIQKPLFLDKNFNLIDVSPFDKGVYILRLSYGNQSKTQKIIIQ